MANYLYNHSSKAFLFRAGYIEVLPYRTVKVSDADVASGIFQQAILSGDLSLYENESDIPPAPTLNSVQPITVKSESSGASQDELKEFIEKQRKKQEEQLKKYATSAEKSEPAEVNLSVDTGETTEAPVPTESVDEVSLTDAADDAKIEASKPARKTAKTKAE